MAVAVSVVSHKGGVGKTTTTVALGEFLASSGRKVLIVDLDAQGNATMALMDSRIWRERDAAGLTVAPIFAERLSGERRFRAELAILRRVSNLGGGLAQLDLLPASPQLTDLQDRLAFIPPGAFASPGPVHVLREALAPILERYEFVLIDCPPSLGLLSLNALAMSDAYLVPVVPDVLSAAGINRLRERVRFLRFLRFLGVVVCRYRAGSTLHRARLEELCLDRSLRAFGAPVPEASALAEAADFGGRPRTLKQKYASRAAYRALAALKAEFLERIGTLAADTPPWPAA